MPRFHVISHESVGFIIRRTQERIKLPAIGYHCFAMRCIIDVLLAFGTVNIGHHARKK
jgi:hypothetical protein